MTQDEFENDYYHRMTRLDQQKWEAAGYRQRSMRASSDYERDKYTRMAEIVEAAIRRRESDPKLVEQDEKMRSLL